MHKVGEFAINSLCGLERARATLEKKSYTVLRYIPFRIKYTDAFMARLIMYRPFLVKQNIKMYILAWCFHLLPIV